MKRDYTGNQRGEVVIGAMVVIMVVMMFFGGMSMMHGGHRHAADQDRKVEEKHDHQNEQMHDNHNHNRKDSSVQDGEARDQMPCM